MAASKNIHIFENGTLMWMGLVTMLSITSYWQTSRLYRNSVAGLMCRNRFQLLLRAWHFVPNDEDGNHENRLHKIDSFLQTLITKFSHTRTRGLNVVIDENMVPFWGQLTFRQYLPNKSHKYVIKLFKICDPAGFTYKILRCIVAEVKQSNTIWAKTWSCV